MDEVRILEIKQSVFANNDQRAELLRRELKEKRIFTRLDSSVLYMAGFCDWFDNSKMPVLLQA